MALRAQWLAGTSANSGALRFRLLGNAFWITAAYSAREIRSSGRKVPSGNAGMMSRSTRARMKSRPQCSWISRTTIFSARRELLAESCCFCRFWTEAIATCFGAGAGLVSAIAGWANSSKAAIGVMASRVKIE